jgi:hypothetical protein
LFPYLGIFCLDRILGAREAGERAMLGVGWEVKKL